jgi:hypothetical protein
MWNFYRIERRLLLQRGDLAKVPQRTLAAGRARLTHKELILPASVSFKRFHQTNLGSTPRLHLRARGRGQE